MRTTNSIFLILLLILGAFSSVGYLIKENGDLRQVIADKDARIAELEAELSQIKKAMSDLSQQAVQNQADLEKITLQLKETQAALEQAHTDLQVTRQNLETSAAALLQTQQTLTQTQKDLADCQAALADTTRQLEQILQERKTLDAQMKAPILVLGGLSSENIGALTAVIMGALVATLSVLQVRIHKDKHFRLPVIRTPEKRPHPKQVTVKMNYRAYRAYLDNLKNH